MVRATKQLNSLTQAISVAEFLPEMVDEATAVLRARQPFPATAEVGGRWS
jgi:hypothetical protein